ncbi:hypothetical protein [Fictibacillus barbaricus]|uniref:Type II secretion system protein n=1 Tax=Fictibacillus barbaricus TaxID=182136 RepID=A0ABU1TZS8_9BACL|nr:hypothetical protein [Fictibacillus barbaricus]MDR7072715.1 hypothetical protein [Fictibacillus barbaricus]
MFQNSKGYLLIECMMGLVIFTAVSAMSIHFVYDIYKESKTTRQLLYAVNEADFAAANYGFNKTLENKEWDQLGTTYLLKYQKGVSDEYEICIIFRGENGKEYKTCAAHL